MDEIHQIDRTNLGILWQRIRTFVLSLLTTKADRSTTLAGYGITDAYTKSAVDEKIDNIPTPQQVTLYQDIALAKTWNTYDDITSDGLSNHNGCQHAATNLAVAKVALMLKGRIEEVADSMPSNGIDGQNGQDGANGLSAYEIAVNNGFVGTEQEWLLSLKGADGANGERGLQGEKGERGEQGIPGEKGEKGDTGAVGPAGADGQNGVNGRDGIDGKDGVDGLGLKGIISTTIVTELIEGQNINKVSEITNVDDIKETGLYLLCDARGNANSILSVESLNENYVIQYVMIGGYIGINTNRFIHRVYTEGEWSGWEAYDFLPNKQNTLYSGQPFTIKVGETVLYLTEDKLQKIIALIQS